MHHLRAGGNVRSPSTYPPSFQPSPSLNSPSVSTPTVSNQHASPPSGASYPLAQTPASNVAPPRQQRASMPHAPYPGAAPGASAQQPIPSEEMHGSQTSPVYGSFPPTAQNYNIHNQTNQGPVLPPFSSIQTMGPPVQQSNVSSVRYQSSEPGFQRSSKHSSGSKRNAPSSSNVTSADSSDFDDDDGGDLPVSGLVAPWEVLRGLADVAIERAAKVAKSYHFPLHLTSDLSRRATAIAVSRIVERGHLLQSVDHETKKGESSTSFRWA